MKKKRKKKQQIKIRYLAISLVSFMISVVINIFFNGDFVSYFAARDSLSKIYY